MDEHIQSIIVDVLEGDLPGVQSGVATALESGLPAGRILHEGLIAAMAEVGARFEREEFFVPEMLVSARAMQGGLALLKPHLLSSNVKAVGTVVLGTVKGDLHDIGKNLVGMMMEGAGFEVIDLGTDVPAERFVEAARSHNADLMGLSALLTTTMPNMKAVIEALDTHGFRNQVRVIVGGAPVTKAFAEKIGADGYAPDASQAVALAKQLIESGSAGR